MTKKATTIVIIILTLLAICALIGFKNLNPATVFLHNDSDMKIEEVEINTTTNIQGTLINNGYFTITIPDSWTYSDWRDDMTNPKKNLEIADENKDAYLSEYHGARAARDGVRDYLNSNTRNPAMVSFNFRPSNICNVNTLRRELQPCEDVSISVNGRVWTGFHGLDKINAYRCCLESADEDGWILEVSISKERSQTFSLEDEGLLIMLSSMHHISPD